MYNITSTPADASTYYKVVHLVTLQHENMNFSPTASSMGGVGPSPSDGAGAAYADPKITKNAKDTPELATPTAFGGGNKISNLTPPTGVEDQ